MASPALHVVALFVLNLAHRVRNGLVSAATRAKERGIRAARATALAHKHVVLDLAHPLPAEVRLRLRETGGQACVVRAVATMARVDGLNVIILDASDVHEPHVRVGDGTEEVVGAMAAVRYLGRLARTYPTTPSEALRVDGALDRFKRTLDEIEAWEWQRDRYPDTVVVEGLCVAADELGGFEWMKDVDRCGVVDACWTGLIGWLLDQHLYTEEALTREFPTLAAWWRRATVWHDPLRAAKGGEDDDDEVGDAALGE